MKKLFIILTSIFLLALASSIVYETNQVFDGLWDINGNEIHGTNQLDNVDVIGFVCDDADCNTVQGTLWNGNTLNTGPDNEIILEYPTQLQGAGYGVYFFKQGYIIDEIFADWAGTGNTGPFSNYLNKKESCFSEVNNFQLDKNNVVVGEQIQITASIPASVNHSGPLNYVPTQLEDYYKVQTKVYLKVYNSTGNLVYETFNIYDIPFSDIQNVQFDWTPTQEDDFTIILETEVTDDKCLASQTKNDSDILTVSPAPLTQCSDNLDNDLDGFIDLNDPDCVNPQDNTEDNWNPGNSQCSDNSDNDLDGLTDLQDPGCSNPQDNDESDGTSQCQDGSDNDLDGLTDLQDPGCSNPQDNDESDEHLFDSVTVTCFDYLIQGKEQVCSAHVETSNNQPENTLITFKYEDGSLFNTCVVDPLSAGCSASNIENNLGTYKVYAQATKTGFASNNSPLFQYTILEDKYNITGLKIFSDVNFTQEDYEFYRGENIYVSFNATDQLGNPVELVSGVVLVSPSGGHISLTKIESANGAYKYSLTPIPSTHDFIGNNQIFSFVFNFTDGSGGQDSVNLTIKNNFPVINPISDKTVEEGNTKIINLSLYEFDKEDSGNSLSWSVSGFDSSIVDAMINGKNLEITGIKQGVSQLTLTLQDLDGDSVSQTITITIEEKEDRVRRTGARTTITSSAETIWQCSGWTECDDGIRTRECTNINPINDFDYSIERPTEIKACEIGQINIKKTTGKSYISSFWFWLIIAIILLILLIIILLIK